MKRLNSLILVAALFLLVSKAESQTNLDVRIVKYDGLKELVLKQRGKVVLVDIWFTL